MQVGSRLGEACALRPGFGAEFRSTWNCYMGWPHIQHSHPSLTLEPSGVCLVDLHSVPLCPQAWDGARPQTHTQRPLSTPLPLPQTSHLVSRATTSAPCALPAVPACVSPAPAPTLTSAPATLFLILNVSFFSFERVYSFISLLRERGREEKERERNSDVTEKHGLVASDMHPFQGPNPQPRPVP